MSDGPGYRHRQLVLATNICNLLYRLCPSTYDEITPKIEYWIEYALNERLTTTADLVDRVSSVTWDDRGSHSDISRFLKEFHDAPQRSDQARSFVDDLCLYIVKWFAVALTEDLQVNWDEDFVSKSGAPGFLRGVSFVGHLIGRGLLSHELVRHHLFKPLTVHYYNKDNHVKQSIRANAIYRLFTAAEHRSFPCPGCGREFGSKDAMDQHYNTEHYFERSEFDEFTTERARDQHHDAVHHWIECPECDREFKTKEAMDQHYSVKHRPKCSVCFNEFTTVAAMKQHYNAQHQLKCPDCSGYFTTESARDQHRQTYHQLRCAHCSDTFKTGWERTRHYETKHTFPCPDCVGVFVSATQLRNHEESEHETYRCPECFLFFKTETVMRRHIGSEHKPPPPPPSGRPPIQSLVNESGEPDRAKLPLRVLANKGTIKTAANVTDPNQYQEIVRPNQFYHQEEDRGRGFSTKDFLDTHTRFPRPGVDNFNTPAQQPQVQAQSNPVLTSATSLDTILCEECFASFPSLRDLKQHKIVGHSWRCMKCFNLPPFEDWIAWRIHFNTVHAASIRSVATTDVKGKKIAIPTEDKPSQLVRDDPGHLGGISLGEVNGQRRNASQNTNIEVNSVATHLERFSSSLVDANKHIISSLPPEVAAPSVTQDEIVSSASHDKGFLTSKGPTLNILVEIDPKPRQGRDGLTYEIASDIASPTVIVSSIESGEPEGKYDTDVFSSHSSGLLDGNSLEKEQHIIISPRGPELGDREDRTMSNTIVAGNHSREEPNFGAQDRLGGTTPSTTEEQYEVARSDSPTSSSVTVRDSNQGDLPHGPLQTRRSKAGLVEAALKVHFGCRICLSNPTPTSYPTATHCGHLFCYECIAAEVLKTSRCPVCKNVLALYCLFKLDVAM